MMPSNSGPERSPLRTVTNMTDSPLTKKAGSTPVKKIVSNVHKALPPRMSLPLPVPDTKEKGSDKQKKTRPSLNKRVSFGGNSINVFYKQSEFSPPENEPTVKAARTISRSSPSPQRSPRFSKPDPRLLSAEDEEGSPSTLEMPKAPVIQEHPPYADYDPSPPVSENASPVPFHRDSIGFNDRQSFGVFVDEDVTRGERDIIRDDQEDMTIEFPRLTSAAKARRISNTSIASDGDITQPLHNLIPRMLQDEEKCDENNSMDDINAEGSPMNLGVEADSEDLARHMHDMAEHKGSEAATGNQASDFPSTENVHNELNNVESLGERPPSTGVKGTDEDPTGPTLNSPEINEADESSHFPSPAVPIRARPVPPNRRKLFDNDVNDDEDNTLHYHDKPTRLSEAPGSNQRKPLGVLSVLPSTPRSATQSKLRSAIEERSSASGKREAASKLRELSSSAMRSSQAEIAASSGGSAVEISFSFRDFLQAVQLNFDKKAETRQRGVSLAPPSQPSDNFNRSSFEGNVLECIRQATVLETFRHQIEILRSSIAQDEEKVETLGHQIESTRPPLFLRMAGHEAMPIHETTTHRVSMKRLRKLSTLKAKEEWVTCRQGWEAALAEKLRAAIVTLEHDSTSLNDSREDHRVANSLFIEQIAGLGLGSSFNDERAQKKSTQEENEQRRAVIHEMSKYRDVKGYHESQLQEEADLKAIRNSLAPTKSSLLASCKDLRETANADSERSVKKVITERMELNSIVAGVSGIKLTRVNKNSISLRALDMMDIQFSLHDERVINTSCRTTSPSNSITCQVWQSYIDGAVSLVNLNGGIKNAKFVRDIPNLLYQCTSTLRQARLVYEDAAFFLDRNMGKIVSGGLRRREEDPCLDLTMEASFYSLKLRSKFDITVTVTSRMASDNSVNISQSARVDNIHRYFGDRPENKVISDLFVESGRRELGLYSLADGLAAVWRCLQ